MGSSIHTTDVIPALTPSLTISETERNWVIGMIMGAMCYGVLIAIGIACLKALRALTLSKGIWNQRAILSLHVTLVLILTTAHQAKLYRENFEAIFKTAPDQLTYFYLNKSRVIIVFLFGLTDGILVWRCYMVQKVLLNGKPQGWRHLCWIFPLFLWIMFVGIGVAAVAVSDPTRPLAEDPDKLSGGLLVASTTCNLLLNIFATANIVIRLLIHRRIMINTFGRASTLSNFHLKIVGIMLESAIINLPVATACTICALIFGGVGLLAWEISVPAQSFSSVLVIYQVAKGRAAGANDFKISEGQLDTVMSTNASTWDSHGLHP